MTLLTTFTGQLRAFTRLRSVRVVAALLAALVLVPGAFYFVPALAGSDQAYVVLSGSMVPTFEPGDVVFVSDARIEDLQVGDIITFRASPGSPVLITHRVIEVKEENGKPVVRTQGDANNVADLRPITSQTLVGKYDFDLPWWGFLVMSLRSKLGYFLFIFLPLGAIILSELVRLYKELDRLDRAQKQAKEGNG